MILILTGSQDATTLDVIKWLCHFDQEIMVLSNEDIIEEVQISNDETVLRFSDQRTLDFSKIKAYWYRRGDFTFRLKAAEDHPAIIHAHLKRELNSITQLIHNRLLELPNLSSSLNADSNRLDVMCIAENAGLKIPSFGVFNTRRQVQDFAVKHGKIVTKPIGDGISLNEDEVVYMQYTDVFGQEDIDRLPESFLPGLFVEYIEKKYELRIFYLRGTCYTMAILSQQDTQTSVDMRHYNFQRPNRTLPYRLPEEIAVKIDHLMRQLSLKTGSIDIIVSPEDEFVFLEVNPVGQFGNVSANCNYYLERNVALHLSKLSL